MSKMPIDMGREINHPLFPVHVWDVDKTISYSNCRNFRFNKPGNSSVGDYPTDVDLAKPILRSDFLEGANNSFGKVVGEGKVFGAQAWGKDVHV